MADESGATTSPAEDRIIQLSGKLELTAKERDEKEALIKERDQRIAELEKENTFNSGFADILSTHTAAKDHKDEIKAKVMSGYSVEDAAYAVLGKAGKLGVAQATQASPAGGSATTVVTQQANKTPTEMTQDERRAQLEKDLMWT